MATAPPPARQRFNPRGRAAALPSSYTTCAHHGDPATDSMNIRPPIPRRSGHWFHEHPATLR